MPLATVPGSAVEPGVTVLSRSRPEYDTSGFQTGEITIRPQLSENVGFEDNVLAMQAKRGSSIIETSASLTGQYNHSDLTSFSGLSMDDNRYPDLPQQSYTNWTGSLGLARSFGRDLLNVSYTHQNLNQTPRDLDVPQLNSPLQYRVDSLQASFRMMFNRLFIQPGITLSRFDYDNGTADDVSYIQSYRDRSVVEPAVTVGYELAPHRDLLLTFRDTVSSYSNEIAGSAGRNSHDQSILFGVDFTEGTLWRYRLLVGYKSRTFENSQYRPIRGPIVEADAVWNPTGLTTVAGSLIRQIEDSADEATVGITATTMQLQVDHELRRNILLQGRSSFSVDDYGQGQGSQNLFTAGAGASWFVNRGIQLSASYDLTHRSSNASTVISTGLGQAYGGAYTDNRYLLNLRLAL